MNKIEVKAPVIINGVIVTEDILMAIDLIQFGGAYGRDISKKEFYPEMHKRYISDCRDLSFHLLQKAINNDQKTMDADDMEIFSKIHWIHDLLDHFNIPEKLIEKLKSNKILKPESHE